MPGPRTAKYPKQLVLMVSTEVYDLIEHLSTHENLRKTEVLRTLLHAGIRKAGYGDVLLADKSEVALESVKAESVTPAP